jgi:site-specific recombinase XerD
MVMTRTRHARPTSAGPFQPFLDSFERALHSDGKSPRTIFTYTYDGVWFGGWMVEHHPDVSDWHEVTHHHLREFFSWLRDQQYSRSYCNQVGRSLQQFFAWYSLEEDLPNPFAKVKPPTAPKIDEAPRPVIPLEQLRALIKDAESGKDHISRRDAALLRFFACTGCRLSEVAMLEVDAVRLKEREATVTGKGSKVRVVKFDHACATALDRYLRMRAKHKYAHLAALWIGGRRTKGMTPSGVRQAICDRAARLGIRIHPHLFRHTFAHRWLDNGGAEGDLMELAGWDSAAMLRVYGRSARSARAGRAYDRVGVLGEL